MAPRKRIVIDKAKRLLKEERFLVTAERDFFEMIIKVVEQRDAAKHNN